MRAILFSWILALAPACGLAQEGTVLRTVPVFRLGGPNAPEEYAFAAPPMLVVDRDGYVFSRVASDGVVSLFSPAGEPVRSYGRKGEGPGEFQVAGGHGLLGDTLWIRNWPAPRISKFTRDGVHIETISTPHDYGRPFSSPSGITAFLAGGHAFVSPSGVVVGATEPVSVPVLVGRFPLTSTDTVAVIRNPSGLHIAQVGQWSFDPVPEPPLVAVAADGLAIAVAEWSDAQPDVLAIRLVEPDGTQRWRRRFRVTADRMPRSVRDSLIAEGAARARPQVEAARRQGVRVEGSIESLVERGLHLPTHYPPARKLMIGVDGTIWIEQSTGTRGGTWMVLDGAGTLQFRVQVPPGLDVQQADRSHIWGTEQDQLGVAYMVKLRIGR